MYCWTFSHEKAQLYWLVVPQVKQHFNIIEGISCNNLQNTKVDVSLSIPEEHIRGTILWVATFLSPCSSHTLAKQKLVSMEWVMMTFTGENFENHSSVGKFWFGLGLKILKGEGSVLFSAWELFPLKLSSESPPSATFSGSHSDSSCTWTCHLSSVFSWAHLPLMHTHCRLTSTLKLFSLVIQLISSPLRILAWILK